MFIAPGTGGWSPQQLERAAVDRIARDWWMLLLEGLLLIIAGVLIFSIDWSVRSLSVFIGALFILHGISMVFLRGVDRSARRTNTAAGLLSVAAGVAIIVWSKPGLLVVAVFLGSWLIVVGTLTITAAFAGRHVIPDWWLWLILGFVEVVLGVLALADPGATLAALITVSGIWAVAVGVMYIVLSFEVKRLPERLDAMAGVPSDDARTGDSAPDAQSRFPRTA